MNTESIVTACAMIVIAAGQAFGQNAPIGALPELAWARQYAPSFELTDDFVQAVGADAEGYVYILGNSQSLESEYFIAKYDPAGTQLWLKTVGGSDFSPQAMVVDAAGAIHLTGNDWSTGSIITASFDADGVQQWLSRRTGVSFSCEYLGSKTKLLAVDSKGNVAVSGCKYDPKTGLLDLVTLRYDNKGVELWTAVFGGIDPSGNPTHDWAVGIAISEGGAVYLTGGSRGQETVNGGEIQAGPVNFTTIKYDPTGNLAWVASYREPSSDESIATGLAVDGEDNVVVTGTSRGSFGEALTTIKYSSQGTEGWVAKYGPPTNATSSKGIGIDSGGNIYVAANDYDGTLDFVAIKYNSSGVQQWRRVYNGGIDDILDMIVVDPPGNVYLTGTSYTEGTLLTGDWVCGFKHLALKYNSDGDEQWSTVTRAGTCGDPEVPIIDAVVDAQSNFISVEPLFDNSTGNPEWDITTTKYDFGGNERWKATYRGKETPSRGQPTATVVDADDNVIITGWTEGSSTGRDITVAKLSPNGEELWVTRYDGFGQRDLPAGIALDAAGNIVVAGYTSIPNSSREDLDFITLKLDPSGELLWAKTLDGPGGVFGVAVSLAVGMSGNIFVTGGSRAGSTGQEGLDFTTVKYGPDGGVVWTTTYDGGFNDGDVARAIELDQHENVYVAGWSVGGDGTSDFATVKYDANGETVWTARFDSPESVDEDTPAEIGIDALGNVYVGGQTDENGGKFAVLKYSPNGTQEWISYYDNHGSSGDHWISDLLVTKTGDVVVTGGSYGDTQTDFATLMFDPNGNQLWETRFDGPDSDHDFPLALDRDESGNTYVTGTTGYRSGLATVKYGPDGIQEWAVSYAGGGTTSSRAHRSDLRNGFSRPSAGLAKTQDDLIFPGDVTVDRDGNVYVAGSSKGVFTVIKYIQGGPVSVEEQPDVSGLFLDQNYPNPFATSTEIRFGTPHAGHVNLKVFNVLGQEVATLFDEPLNSGSHAVEWRPGFLSKGIYVYRLQVGDRVLSRTLLMD